MKKVSLLFGIHMQQPVDNFDDAEKFGLLPQTNEWVYGKK